MRFVIPLRRTYPRQSFNTEVAQCLQKDASGFCVSTRCTSAGVPFSNTFANYLFWTAQTMHPEGAEGPIWTRLRVTAECRFHGSVWAPIRSQIVRESEAGMKKAYGGIATELGCWFEAKQRLAGGAMTARIASRQSGVSRGQDLESEADLANLEQPSGRWVDTLNLLLLSMLMTLLFRWLFRLNKLRFLEAPSWRPWLEDTNWQN